MSKLIKWFSEVGKEDVKEVGGKGANLGEMVGIGLPIPPGFVVTAESYRLLHGAVTEALKLAGIAAELAPCCGPNDRNVCFAGPVQYDIVVAGAKVAGAAQRRLKRGLLHQGSILLPETATVRGGPPALNDALRLGFEQEIGVAFEVFHPTPALFNLAEQLCSEKYRTRAWTERCRA